MSWWDDITGQTASFNARQAQAEAQDAQQRALDQQIAIAKQQSDDLAAREAKTTANIQGGKSAIDTAFAQFDDPYFANVAKTYSDYYTPQVDQQQDIAHDKLTAQLAGQGVLDSTVGANSLATLAKTAADKRTQIANSGQDYANTVRGNVNTAKNQLYTDNTGAAEPGQVASQATGSATTLANQASVSPVQPVGDLFSSLLQPVSNFATAASNAYRAPSSYTSPTSGSGSSSIIK